MNVEENGKDPLGPVEFYLSYYKHEKGARMWGRAELGRRIHLPAAET
jgi:hypothetical protein